MSLQVESFGKGAPLLLIHGWGMHGGVWDKVATQLAQNFRVHCVDLPGHGFNVGRNLSRQSIVGLKPDLQIDSIVDQLSAQFSEPLAVCGWSLGGQIALHWAIRHPQQINRLVLVATTPCFVQRPDWPCAMAAEMLTEFSDALQENYAQTLRRFVALQMHGSERERELLADVWQRLFSRGEPDGAALQHGLEILRDTDLRAQLKVIVHKALVIAGERDKLIPLAASIFLAQSLPAAHLVKIAGAAHAPFLSHPDIFVQHVTDFMYE